MTRGEALTAELVHAGTLDGHPLTEERAARYAAVGLESAADLKYAVQMDALMRHLIDVLPPP